MDMNSFLGEKFPLLNFLEGRFFGIGIPSLGQIFQWWRKVENGEEEEEKIGGAR